LMASLNGNCVTKALNNSNIFQSNIAIALLKDIK